MSDKNYVLKQGVLIDQCDDTTGWVNFGSNGVPSFSVDTSIVKTGSASLLFSQADASASRTVARYKNLTTTLNLSDGDGFYIWVYSPDGKKSTNTIALYFATSSAFASYALATLGATSTGTQKKGWNLWRVKKSDFFLSGGFDWTNVSTVMLKWNTVSSADSIYVDGIYFGYTALPKIILTMDDGDVSQKYAAEHANSLGLPVTLYVIKDYSTDAVTYPGTIQTDDLVSLYNAGNDIGLHHQTNLTTVPVATAQGYLEECRSWLVANGMTRAANHLAWPNGAYSFDLMGMAGDIGLDTARGILGVGVTAYNFENTHLGVASPFSVNAMPLSGNSLATVQAAVDRCISDGINLFLYVHTIKESGGEWTISDWESLCSYIESKQNSNLVDVVTISQWSTGLEHSAPSYGATFGPWSALAASLPLSAQPCKSHALPIGVGKVTVFPGVASSAQIEESK